MYEAAEDHCAWCYERLKPDNPPFGVFARLRNRRRALRAQARQMRAALGPARPAAAGTGERILVVPFGDHDVPGRLAESGSPAALGGFDIGFIVCSAECEAALVAAMEDHRLLSVVH